MEPHDSTIPKFCADGYLPEGLYLASKTEVMFRFGSSSRRRRRLVLRIRRWIELARLIGGLRLLIDGSFVTAKAEPETLTRLFCSLRISNTKLSKELRRH